MLYEQLLSYFIFLSGENLSRKVIFFARTVPLVMQQYRVLQKFLPLKFRVSSFSNQLPSYSPCHVALTIMSVHSLLSYVQSIISNIDVSPCIIQASHI